MSHIALYTYKTGWSGLLSLLQKPLELPGGKFSPYMFFFLKLFLVLADLGMISPRISLHVLLWTTQIIIVIWWALAKMSDMCIWWNCHKSKVFGNSEKSKLLRKGWFLKLVFFPTIISEREMKDTTAAVAAVADQNQIWAWTYLCMRSTISLLTEATFVSLRALDIYNKHLADQRAASHLLWSKSVRLCFQVCLFLHYMLSSPNTSSDVSRFTIRSCFLRTHRTT